MKCIKAIIILIIIIAIPGIVQATDDVLEEQKGMLNISSFIKEANTYTKEAFPQMDMGETLNSAIKGEIKGDFWRNIIFGILGKEIMNALRTLGTVLVIIVIHSVLKSISDGLENKSVSEIIYYVEYILIVTLIMTSFSELIVLVKETIENLVGFMNSLVPILITLMITTGNIATAGVLQPIILYIIGFIGNTISAVIIPFTMIATVLGIISNISSKIHIDKLAKYFKSGVTWLLGAALTIFVGIISIDGTLTSSVDGITAKTAKAAVSSFVPVVGKILGDAVDTVMGCATVLKNAVRHCGSYSSYWNMPYANDKDNGNHNRLLFSYSNLRSDSR